MFNKNSIVMKKLLFCISMLFCLSSIASAGENVDSGSIGDVIVNSGSTLFIQKGSGGVLLDNGFKCETGAGLEVK